MENRSSVIASGVAEVGSFGENEIKVRLSSGVGMTVAGEKLGIIGFDKRTGELRLVGKINSVKYSDRYLPKAGKFFK